MNGRNQIVVTHLEGRTAMLYMQGEKLYDIYLEERETPESVLVGDIYVGRVKNIVQNIRAAFVEVKKGVLCYLPLSDVKDRNNASIQCGDELLIQIKKAGVKTKQPVATLDLELVGRSVVVSFGRSERGISKKITDREQSDRLRQILDEFQGEPYGMTMRTNAANMDTGLIREECRRLLDTLHEIIEKGKYRPGCSLLYQEGCFYLKHLNDYLPEEWERIVTDDPEIYRELDNRYRDQVVFYEDATYTLDQLYGLTNKLYKALEKKVWLKSGGNLVIEPTEALTVIDVNTGKAIEGKRNRETTFYKINCEAAIEAARQIRIRGISGIILIDFIDMQKQENKKMLLDLLREELKKDKVRASLIDITKLGLVEITRMKKYPSLKETLREPKD